MSRRELFGLRFCKVGVPPIMLVLAVLGIDHRRHRGADRGGVDGRAGLDRGRGVGAGRFSFRCCARRALATTQDHRRCMMFILICAQVFALAFRGLHGEKLVEDLFEWCPAASTATSGS